MLVYFSTLFRFLWSRSFGSFKIDNLGRIIQWSFLSNVVALSRRTKNVFATRNVVTRPDQKINGNWTECAYNNPLVAWSRDHEPSERASEKGRKARARMRFATRQSVDVFHANPFKTSHCHTHATKHFPSFLYFSFFFFLFLSLFSLCVCVRPNAQWKWKWKQIDLRKEMDI